MRKRNAFRLATAADNFNNVRGEIGQREEARDVKRGQVQLLYKVTQAGRLPVISIRALQSESL